MTFGEFLLSGPLVRRRRPQPAKSPMREIDLGMNLLDTNVLSEVRHPRGSARVKNAFLALGNDLCLSAIVLGEIRYGIAQARPAHAGQALERRLVCAASSRLRPPGPARDAPRSPRPGAIWQRGCAAPAAADRSPGRPDRRHGARPRPHPLDPQHPRLRRHGGASLQPLGRLMDFALTDEQQAIRDMARDFGRERIAPHALAWEAEGIPRDVLAEAGRPRLRRHVRARGDGRRRPLAASTPRWSSRRWPRPARRRQLHLDPQHVRLDDRAPGAPTPPARATCPAPSRSSATAPTA